MIRTVLPTILLALSALAACGKDGPTEPTLDPPAPARIAVSPKTTTLFAFGEKVQLEAVVFDQYDNVYQGATVVWKGDGKSVASVIASGLVTAIGNGTARITAVYAGATGTAIVVVQQTASWIRIEPYTVEFRAVGEFLQLTARVVDRFNNEVRGAEVTWSSSDPAVVGVNIGGRVRALRPGEATITATSGRATGSMMITVGAGN